MAEVIPQITIDGSKVKETWVQNEVVTNDVYNAINKAVINLKDNNNLLDSNAMLFREEYNSSSKNLNNAIHQGIYSFTSSAVNAPSGVNGGNLLVTNTSKTNQGSSIITQIAFCHNGAVYARTKNTSENFTAWNKLAYITDNVASATKASQDSQGQDINTTYVKDVTGSNATLTVTKGNGTANTVTINNVEHSTNADNANKAIADKNGLDIAGGYLKLTGGFMVGYIINNDNNDDFRILTEKTKCGFFTNNNIGTGFFDWSKQKQIWLFNTSEYTLSSDINSIKIPTPATSDNSQQVATTAFVQSLLTQKFTASKQQNGWWKDGNTGIIWQWGSYYTDGTKQYFTFPITFPNGLFAITEAHITSADNDFKTCSIINPDENGFTINSTLNGYTTNVIAIGY